MIDENLFVEASVSNQIGAHRGVIAQSEAALIRAFQGSSGASLAYLPQSNEVLTYAGGDEVTRRPLPVALPELGEKAATALREIRAHAPRFGFIIDMQDRRLRQVAEPAMPPYPVFSFNRAARDAARILWPLGGYHDLDGAHFLNTVNPDAVAWEAKAPTAVWRGITGGRVMALEGGGEGRRLKAILKQLRRDPSSFEAAKAEVGRVSRYYAVSFVAQDPRFDFGFTDGDGYDISHTPFHEALERPRLTRAQMQQHKFIAVLRGLDVGSSFYWVMNSGSVGLVMETPFETFASGHYRPFEHFVPFREDCADLVARLDWARSHDAECREMVRRAAEVSALVGRSDLRERILKGVIARMNDFRLA